MASTGEGGRAARAGGAIDVSIVVPARDEADNVAPLVAEIEHVMAKTALDYELILVDDGSTDATAERIRVAMTGRPAVRGLSLERARDGGGHGQSAALRAGLLASRGASIVTLDADGQNDPSEIPRLLELLDAERADLVQGDRSGARRDPWLRRAAGGVGRVARRLALGDAVRDTGCSLRAFRREVGLALPLELSGMHRFVPYTARLLGYDVIETPVLHRPRTRGRSKYGLLDRAFAGLRDLLAVRWMSVRLRRPAVRELPRAEDDS